MQVLGTLTISNGVQVTSFNGFIGSQVGLLGTVNVDGRGSTWTMTGSYNNSQELYFNVGDNGAGVLNITNGGSVTAAALYSSVGGSDGGQGTMVVDGKDGSGNPSTFTTPNELYIGWWGPGALRVTNGGQVLVTEVPGNYNSVVARNAPSTALIDGTGSKWSTYQLIIGMSANGTVTVSNGGTLQAHNVDGYGANKGFLFFNNGTLQAVSSNSAWIGPHGTHPGIPNVYVSSGRRQVRHRRLQHGHHRALAGRSRQHRRRHDEARRRHADPHRRQHLHRPDHRPERHLEPRPALSQRRQQRPRRFGRGAEPDPRRRPTPSTSCSWAAIPSRRASTAPAFRGYITGTGSLQALSAPLGGDADANGTVNGADLNIVLSNYNQTGMNWFQGDFDGNGTVNGADLNIVLSNYNQSVSVGAAVPEPSTLLLAPRASSACWPTPGGRTSRTEFTFRS